jgi:hypothetical protein
LPRRMLGPLDRPRSRLRFARSRATEAARPHGTDMTKTARFLHSASRSSDRRRAVSACYGADRSRGTARFRLCMGRSASL